MEGGGTLISYTILSVECCTAKLDFSQIAFSIKRTFKKLVEVGSLGSLPHGVKSTSLYDWLSHTHLKTKFDAFRISQ